MRKEEIRGLVIYLLMILAAIIIGFTVIRNQMSLYGPEKMSPLLFIIIVLVVAYLFNVIGLEILHVLGSIAGGYKITGVNILGFGFYKKGNEFKFSFRDFNGISGETKIAPKKEKLNPNLQTWFPLFGFAIELGTCIVVASIIKSNPNPKTPWLVPASTIILLIACMLAFYNFVPLKLDSETDGYKIRLFANPINIKAYNQMLEIQEKKRLGEDVEEIPTFEEITEYTAEINTLAMYKYLEVEKFDDAEKIMDKLLESKKFMSMNDHNRLVAQKLYLVILTKPLDEAKKLYDELAPTEVRRFIANDVSMASIRAYIMIAGMIEGSESEVMFAKSKIEKAKKRALASEIIAEEKLLEKALNHVYEAHPKWEKEKVAE